MLKAAKLSTLRLAKSLGLFHALGRSQWRKDRLFILAYHGVSQDDEHLWNPELYLTPELFRGRMSLLKKYGCNVLPLEEALQKLWAGTLPDRSVVLTFDDGSSDFYRQAFSVIKEFGWPVTLYLTSYYSGYNRPVFDVMCSYLLWKGSGVVVDARGVISGAAEFDLRSAAGRSAAERAILLFAKEEKFSAEDKDALLTRLAARLRLNYEAILSKRILHLLSVEEIAQLAAEGVDIQMHTHRHHSPKKREFFLSEVEENRHFIERFTKPPSHFCYPGGIYEHDFTSWLREDGIVSATTCAPGLATRESNRFDLPRLVDTCSIHSVELEGWLSGFSSFLPRRPIRPDVSVPPFYYCKDVAE